MCKEIVCSDNNKLSTRAYSNMIPSTLRRGAPKVVASVVKRVRG
jgi:hypothetical protein